MPVGEQDCSMRRKDQFDAYIAQADFAWRSFDTRRAYEWKITLGLWAAIGGAIVFVKDISDISISVWWTGIGALIIGLTYVTQWLVPLWRRNAEDKKRADKFQKCAEEILSAEYKKPMETGTGSKADPGNSSPLQSSSASTENPLKRGWCESLCNRMSGVLRWFCRNSQGERHEFCRFCGDWSMRFQMITTGILLFIAVAAYSFLRHQCPGG